MKTYFKYNYLYKLILGLLLVLSVFILSKKECFAEDVVVVIDPGHGGSNLGGHTDEYIEQELTVQVARYMKERLEQYEGVTVYITHEEIGDKDLSREERADIAAEHNADFLFSLHFNMSEFHTLYGFEVWTSAFGDYYARGQEFGRILMDTYNGELGFFDRGIKTKLGKDGDDYYGIILYSQKKGIPAVIIEHCHLDESRDNYFLKETENPYKVFGYADADAVAKYFRLSSASLGLDYSNYQYDIIAAPSSPIGQDKTAPEICNIELEGIKAEEGNAVVGIEASDSDGSIQYYQYSTDGGNSYSLLFPWNDDPEAKFAQNSDRITVSIPLVTGEESNLMIRVYNRYELYTDSDVLILPAGEEVPALQLDNDSYDDYEEIIVDTDKKGKNRRKSGEDEKQVDELLLYMVGGLLVLSLLISIFLVVYVANMRKKRRRRRRRRGQY